MKVIPKTRGRDSQGAGYYGASRGSRKHNGIDFVAEAGERVCAFVGGTITKLGYAYSDDLSYRYIELVDASGMYCRYFYVEPLCNVGDIIANGETIGRAQDIAARYQGITPHYHFEVFEGAKHYVNPYAYLSGDA